METTFFELPDDLRNIIWRRARFASARESVERRILKRDELISKKQLIIENSTFTSLIINNKFRIHFIVYVRNGTITMVTYSYEFIGYIYILDIRANV